MLGAGEPFVGREKKTYGDSMVIMKTLSEAYLVLVYGQVVL